MGGTLLPPLGGGDRGAGKPRMVAIPGMPGESIDSRLLPDVRWLLAAFKVKVTDGYAASGHAAGGDHPKGAGVDLVPNPAAGGTWDDVDRLAAFAKKHPDVFRWIGYDGVPNHGRGHHLHLSWHGFGTDGDSRPIKLLTSSGNLADFANPVELAKTAAAIAGDPGAALGLAGDAAGDAALKTAQALVGLIVKAIGKDGARVLLSIALVAGAVAAIGFGAARAVGLRPPPIPAAKALTAAKGAA